MTGRGSRSAAEIAQDIAGTRQRIGLTLDALTQRLEPHRLWQRGLAMTSRYVRTTAAAAGLHIPPMALGLIGAGVAWLVGANIGHLRRREPEEAQNAAMRNGQIPESAGASEGSSGNRAPPSDLSDGSLLLFGLLCLGAGAALAELLPAGPREQAFLAQARETAWQAAETLGHQTAARLRNLRRCPAATPAHEPRPE
jgi:Protein of unknown function (DUF3618)